MSKSEFVRLAGETEERKLAGSLPAQLDTARLSKYVADSVTLREGGSIPDCVTCGVCCDIYSMVPMGLDDSERLGIYVEITDDSETDLVVDRLIPRDWDRGVCVFLSGEVGRHVGCTVYEKRPGVCRNFEAGSDRCRELRRMYGLEPQLSKEEVELFAEALAAPRPRGVISNAVCQVVSVSNTIDTAADNEGDAPVLESVIAVKIFAAVDGDIENWTELHTYNPDQELWLQSGFIGMTVEEARRLIAARCEQGVSN
jgi:uncharacterized protein